MFGRVGPMELILILVIALVIFGPKKLPEIGKAIGTAIKEFKKHTSGVSESIEDAVNAPDEAPQTQDTAKGKESEPMKKG